MTCVHTPLRRVRLSNLAMSLSASWKQECTKLQMSIVVALGVKLQMSIVVALGVKLQMRIVLALGVKLQMRIVLALGLKLVADLSCTADVGE